MNEQFLTRINSRVSLLRIMNENEYTISGYNFRILNISKEDNYYLIDVEPFKY